MIDSMTAERERESTMMMHRYDCYIYISGKDVTGVEECLMDLTRYLDVQSYSEHKYA